MRAEVLYRCTVGPEPESPEQVAKEYEPSVEAVLEAIHYCHGNRDLLDAERSTETEGIRACGLDPTHQCLRMTRPRNESVSRR